MNATHGPAGPELRLQGAGCPMTPTPSTCFHTASCALSPSVRRKAGLQAFYFCDLFFS